MNRDASKIVVPGKDLIPISAGETSTTGNKIIVEDFNGDEAILISRRHFEAEDYPFIKVNLSGFTRFTRFKIVWRQADNLEETHALEFNRSGDKVTQIAMAYAGKHYRGAIADVALLFYDGPALGFENNNNVDIIIDSIEFRPFSAARVAEQIVEDWTNPPLAKGYSTNFVRGIHPNGMIFPNAVANLLVITGVVLASVLQITRRWRAISPPQHRFIATALCLCLYAWAFNDLLRWHWRVEQLIDSHERYAGLSLEERIRNSDLRCARFPTHCAKHLQPYF